MGKVNREMVHLCNKYRNETLRKLGAIPNKNRCKCNSKSYLFLENFQVKQATQPDQILIFYRQKSRQTSDIFSLENLSSLHLILGKSRIITQLVDGNNTEKNRPSATRPREKMCRRHPKGTDLISWNYSRKIRR